MADDLGIALQVTNILRDVREDFRNGRVYLPAEDLAKFGCEFAPGQPEPFAPTPTGRRGSRSLVEFEASRAREWYASGMRLLATIDWRSAACTGAMAGIYRRLLEKIAADPRPRCEGRMSLPGKEKALVAVRQRSVRRGQDAACGPPKGAVPSEGRPCIGGGLAGITAALALATHGARGHAAGGQAAAGRRDHVVQP